MCGNGAHLNLVVSKGPERGEARLKSGDVAAEGHGHGQAGARILPIAP